jgi:hypothetical protein
MLKSYCNQIETLQQVQYKPFSFNTRFPEYVKRNSAWICDITTDIRVTWEAGVE